MTLKYRNIINFSKSDNVMQSITHFGAQTLKDFDYPYSYKRQYLTYSEDLDVQPSLYLFHNSSK